MKAPSLIILVLLSFFLGIQPDEKVAIIIMPSEDPDSLLNARIELTSNAIDILEANNYEIRFVNTTHIPTVYERQIVVLYIGHGARNSTTLFTQGGMISLSQILAHIQATNMILITTACMSGSWLEFSEEGRIIIGASNNTLAYIGVDPKTGEVTSPTIVTLLDWWEQYQYLELAYEMWAKVYTDFFNSFGKETTPYMDDRIEGDVLI